MPKDVPARPTRLDLVLVAVWFVVAGLLPVEDFWGVLSLLAAIGLTGWWLLRVLGAMLTKKFSWHVSWLAWPLTLFAAALLHLWTGFEYFYFV